MRKLSRRTLLLTSLAVTAIPLGAIAVTAYACTSVATLSDSQSAALPGSTITVTGAFFGTHNASDATSAGLVQLRLGSLTGPVLATASPSGTGRSFSVPVTIPADATPGETFITATQNTATGTPVYGTPARQAFTVTAPTAAAPPVFAPVLFSPLCVVPDVEGKVLASAERMIRTASCSVGKVTTPKKPKAKRHHKFKLVVASSGLVAGTATTNGTKVNLRLHWI